LLICRGVEVAYGQVQVLFGVDMQVQPGGSWRCRPNGANKSIPRRSAAPSA
jgi:ABC-type branched-subunit amino acid transport system ATPase component